ncbi:MAG TPA: ABC transporter permease [Thermomicrobiales bacterium]|nr:ABC transporter permease [Thermomicrobiales bacterium]
MHISTRESITTEPREIGLAAKPRSPAGDVARRFVRNRLALAGLFIVVMLTITAIAAPVIAPKDPAASTLGDTRARPSREYLLGADELGRDILSRIIYGSRVALLVAVLAVGAATLVGGGIGLIAGFAGGWIDEVLMRLMDILLAFPYLLLAIAIVSALGSGVEKTTIAVAIWAVPNFARVVRGQVLTLKERDYVLAARALGARTPRLLLVHITPNIIAPIIVFGSLYMANAILLEAALSFLGLGVQPPQASWGLMVASGRDFLRVDPHVTTFPGIAIMITVLGFNLLGDGLRDAMDPRLRNRF